MKIEKKETKIEVPKDFLKKIKKLCLREEDAHILYKTKINWTAVYSKNKLYCSEVTCDFFTKIDNGELTNHMIEVHKYGEYKCEDPHCNFVGFSQQCLNIHGKMHTRQANSTHVHKCLKCGASFRIPSGLIRHMRIHNNELDTCQYCPYRYESPNHYQGHLKAHFGIKDFECDQCEMKFPTAHQLNVHYEKHEEITYCCLICNDYEAKLKTTIEYHLKRKHPEVLKNQKSWVDIRKFTKTK